MCRQSIINLLWFSFTGHGHGHGVGHGHGHGNLFTYILNLGISEKCLIITRKDK